MIRILLNGKKAYLPEIREAVTSLRDNTFIIDVRVTWEDGDIYRLVNEAVRDGVTRLVAAGGDGTINQVVDAVMSLPNDSRPEIAILPLGTANDFATACLVPTRPVLALRLALEGETKSIDVGKANERHFINVASGGFGTQVTVETPVQLKNFLGGGAYTLTGILKALSFKPISGHMKTSETEKEVELIAAAVCNGRLAGGGQVLAPGAYINDGLLDIVTVSTFPPYDLDLVISEIFTPTQTGRYIRRFQARWIETSSAEKEEQVNLDGEPYSAEKIRFEVLPGAMRFVLPENCPLFIQEQADNAL